jgi:DnaJ-domain-containing protein 1
MSSPDRYDIEYLFPPMAPEKREAFLRDRAELASSLRAQGERRRAAMVEFNARVQAFGVELIDRS